MSKSKKNVEKSHVGLNVATDITGNLKTYDISTLLNPPAHICHTRSLYIFITNSFLVVLNNGVTESKQRLCLCLPVAIAPGWITRPARPLISSHALLLRAEGTGPHDEYVEP